MAITRNGVSSNSRSTTGTDASVTHTVVADTTLLVVSTMMEAGEDVNGTPTWSGNGTPQDLTLIDIVGDSGSNNDVSVWTYALVNPTPEVDGTITVTHTSNDNFITVATNYLGTKVSATMSENIAFLSEDDNNPSVTNNISLASGGTAGNTLYAAGAFKGGDGAGITGLTANFAELYDAASGTSPSADISGAVVDYIGGAASACAWTWAATDDNCAHYFEISPAAVGDQIFNETLQDLDSVAATDLTVELRSRTRQQSDSHIATDSTVELRTRNRTPTADGLVVHGDALVFENVFSKAQRTRNREQLDTHTATDNKTATYVESAGVVNNVTLQDLDSTAATDALASLRLRDRAQAETSEVTDVTALLRERNRAQTDTTAATDLLATERLRDREQSESIEAWSEREISNLTKHSEDASDALWLKNACTIDTNVNGTMDRINITTGSDEHRIAQLQSGAIGSDTHTIAADVINDGAGFATILLAEVGERFFAVTFDLSDGSITQQDVGIAAGTIIEAGSIDLGGGLWRLWATGITSSSGDTLYSYVGTSNAGTFTGNTVGLNVYAGVEGEDIIVGRMQCNTGAYARYVPTTSAAITRSSNVIEQRERNKEQSDSIAAVDSHIELRDRDRDLAEAITATDDKVATYVGTGSQTYNVTLQDLDSVPASDATVELRERDRAQSLDSIATTDDAIELRKINRNLPERTNLLTYSEDLSVSAWAKLNSTVPSLGNTSPIGNEAFAVVEADNTAGHYVYNPLAGDITVSAGKYSTTAFVKPLAAGNRWLAPMIWRATDDCESAIIDLDTGVVSAEVSGSSSTFTNVSYSVEELLDGWFRVGITFDCNAGLIYSFWMISNSATPTRGTNLLISYDGDIGSNYGFALWGAQLEPGYISPYISTTSVAVTNYFDSLNIPDNAIELRLRDRELLDNAVVTDDKTATYVPASSGAINNVTLQDLDSIPVDDINAELRERAREQSQQADVNDATAEYRHRARSATSAIEADDSTAPVSTRTRQQLDSLDLSETTETVRERLRALSNTAAVTDFIIVTTDQAVVTKTITDTISVVDAVAAAYSIGPIEFGLKAGIEIFDVNINIESAIHAIQRIEQETS